MRASAIAGYAFTCAVLYVVFDTSPIDRQTPEPVPEGRFGQGDAARPPFDAGTDANETAEASDAGASDASPIDGGETEAPPSDAQASPCPDDMVFVDTDFCSEVERRCVDMEHEKINHLQICHAFEHETRCRGPRKHISVCVDRYEYPNQKGAHPVWMLDWYDAQATCESKGKRLCWSSEWTAACEGPEHTPFPYGWERDHDKCNMDNFFIDPKKPNPKGQFYFYSKDPAVAAKELARLDQSVPSGSMETCKSGFGAYDMPGNVDEWVTSDEPPHEISQWAALKGGAWGHVRSQCRPATYSHDPGFAYYFVGFRCCKDVPGAPAWKPSRDAVPAPSVEPRDFTPEPIARSENAGPSKTKFSRTGKTE
jgi:sulfatase modifying factor 1